MLALLASLVPGPLASPASATVPGASGKIAFVSGRDGNAEIYAMDADGTNQVRLTADPAADFAPAWSPDGRRIAFASQRDGDAEIYAMDADGTNQVRLTADPAYDTAPAWSPGGARIAFERRGDRSSAIYVMGADGGNPRRLLAGGPPYQGHPSWSPDGARILFVGGYPGAPGDLYVANADGSGVARLTATPGLYDWPSWSPDGARILFTLADPAGGSTQVHAMGADGRSPARLTDPAVHPAGAFAPAWSPDGARVAFASRRDGELELYAMDAGGGNQGRLTVHPAFDSEPDWQATRPGAAGTTRSAPTSKDDCKGDGWRRFASPSFKNQGQCVTAIGRR